MENYISFEHGDRLEELLDQLARTTRLLEQHDRGDDDDALADAVVQLLIAEETPTRAVDDLLGQAVVPGDESLRGLAAMYRAVSTDRHPNHTSLMHRLRRRQQWRAALRPWVGAGVLRAGRTCAPGTASPLRGPWPARSGRWGRSSSSAGRPSSARATGPSWAGPTGAASGSRGPAARETKPVRRRLGG